MNFLSKIVVDVEKFLKGTATDAEKFAAAFWKWLKKSPSVLQTVSNFLGQAGPTITLLVGLADPAVEPAVAAALAMVEGGLGAVGAALTAATTGGSLLANLEAFAADVPNLLNGVEIKDPALKAKIEAFVNWVLAETKVLIPIVGGAVKAL